MSKMVKSCFHSLLNLCLSLLFIVFHPFICSLPAALPLVLEGNHMMDGGSVITNCDGGTL
jgi:hypothetical protein